MDRTDETWTSVTLRISGAALEPRAVSEAIGRSPDWQQEDGDLRVWSMVSHRPPVEALEAHLDAVLTLVEPGADFIRQLSDENAVTLLCALYRGNGWELKPPMQARIARIGAAVQISSQWEDEADSGEDDADDAPHIIAHFRIFGPGLDPQAITERLQITPTHFHYEGDQSKNPRVKPYAHGMWGIDSSAPDTEPFEKHVAQLVTLLEPYADYIRGLSQDYSVDIGGMVTGLPVTLPASLLERTARLGCLLGGTIYM